MKLRHLLATGILFLAASLISPGQQAATTGRPTKIALKYGMIKSDGTVLERFEIAKQAGFLGIEPNAPLDEKTVTEMAAASKATGVLVPGLVCPQGGRDMGSLDETTRLAGVETMKTALRQAKALGATTVLMYPGKVDKDHPYMDVYNALVKSTREVIPTARETGVKIALENVWNNIFMSPLEALRFLEEINDPSIGWFLDLGNVARFGWPEHWVKALGPHIFKLDIKGYSRTKQMEEGPYKGFNVEIGEDEIDWKSVMATLDESSYKGEWISAEVSGGNLEHLTKVRQQVEKVIAP